MTNEYIFDRSEQMVRKYRTRDPYELLDCIGAETYFTDEFAPDGLKGYCTIIKRIKFAVINSHLDEHESRIVAGHEAAHLILHKNEIFNSPVRALKDFNLYTGTGRTEYQANSFLADFLLSDDEVLESISDEYKSFFSSARELYVPPDLFAFKLYSMMKRGHKVRSPIDPDSKFLK